MKKLALAGLEPRIRTFLQTQSARGERSYTTEPTDPTIIYTYIGTTPARMVVRIAVYIHHTYIHHTARAQCFLRSSEQIG